MRFKMRLVVGLVLLGAPDLLFASERQFVLFNTSPGVESEAFRHVTTKYGSAGSRRVRVGVGRIFSYLQHPPEETARDLKRFLLRAQEQNVPIVVQLDGENWWGNRADLWNWWDPSRPGFSESNRFNVEWAGWSAGDALKIAWRNWGAQIRVLPPPNLMSPAYRLACHEEMRVLVPLVLEWWAGLPVDQKDLLVGIKLGWETSIGVNAWYYPGGNELLSRPATNDPVSGLKGSEVPARGVAQIGYASVSAAGIRTQGEIRETDLAEVARRHLEDLCAAASRLGVPRERLFTHVAGWKENELLYTSGVNRYSCPGWSFYDKAADPLTDRGVRKALEKSDAPYWAAVEWLYQGPPQAVAWRAAVMATLQARRCRYLCIYNWQGIRDNPEALDGISEAVWSLNEEKAGKKN